MQDVYKSYLTIIKNIGAAVPEIPTFTPETEEALIELAQRHSVIPFLLPYIKNPEYVPFVRQEAKKMLFNYYQIEEFTKLIVSLFDEHQIPYFLLKGISLCACYPSPESRKVGDVDIYINEPAALAKAKQVLEKHGFLFHDELSDHHLSYSYTFPATGRVCLLELHFRVIGLYQYSRANTIIDHVFSPENLRHSLQQINHTAYSVLSPTENVFYMLHHMLKHYLYGGFGIRLLCDFTFYLRQHTDQIDFKKVHTWCRDSRILHFYEIVLQSCRLFLGLDKDIDPEIQYSISDCEIFIEKILSDNDMGTVTENTLVGSSSYRRITFATYLKEGHLQMHVRFPHLGKCPLLWPALWCITLICFLYNTYKRRNTTLKDTLSEFRQKNTDSLLIRIFDNSDS